MTNPPPASKPWRGLLLLGLVFFLGAACGIGGGLLVMRGLAQRAFKGDLRASGPVDFLAGVLEQQIATDLELTPAQRAAAHQELETTVARFKDLRAQLRTDARIIVADTVTRVEQHLPPEKRPLLRQRVKDRLGDWGLVP